MQLTTKGVTEPSGSKYIQAGINDVIDIVEIRLPAKDKNKAYDGDKPRMFEVVLKKGGEDVSTANAYPFWISSDAAVQYSLSKLKHLGSRVVTAAQIDAVVGTDTADYVKKMNALLAGKSLRMKFTGEEYLVSDTDENGNQIKKIRTRTEIPLTMFAEAINEGAEYSPVAETKLTYDESNDKDLKRVEIPDGWVRDESKPWILTEISSGLADGESTTAEGEAAGWPRSIS